MYVVFLQIYFLNVATELAGPVQMICDTAL